MPVYLLAFKSNDKARFALVTQKDTGWRVTTWNEGDTEPVVYEGKGQEEAVAIAEEWTK